MGEGSGAGAAAQHERVETRNASEQSKQDVARTTVPIRNQAWNRTSPLNLASGCYVAAGASHTHVVTGTAAQYIFPRTGP